MSYLATTNYYLLMIGLILICTFVGLSLVHTGPIQKYRLMNSSSAEVKMTPSISLRLPSVLVGSSSPIQKSENYTTLMVNYTRTRSFIEAASAALPPFGRWHWTTSLVIASFSEVLPNTKYELRKDSRSIDVNGRQWWLDDSEASSASRNFYFYNSQARFEARMHFNLDTFSASEARKIAERMIQSVDLNQS